MGIRRKPTKIATDEIESSVSQTTQTQEVKQSEHDDKNHWRMQHQPEYKVESEKKKKLNFMRIAFDYRYYVVVAHSAKQSHGRKNAFFVDTFFFVVFFHRSFEFLALYVVQKIYLSRSAAVHGIVLLHVSEQTKRSLCGICEYKNKIFFLISNVLKQKEVIKKSVIRNRFEGATTIN